MSIHESDQCDDVTACFLGRMFSRAAADHPGITTRTPKNHSYKVGLHRAAASPSPLRQHHASIVQSSHWTTNAMTGTFINRISMMMSRHVFYGHMVSCAPAEHPGITARTPKRKTHRSDGVGSPPPPAPSTLRSASSNRHILVRAGAKVADVRDALQFQHRQDFRHIIIG